MMDDLVIKELEQEEITEFHRTLLQDTRALVALSRRKMSEYYDQWDKNDDVYRSMVHRDKEDKAAADRGEPEKMVVPITYSQIQSFVAFCMSLFTQRDRMFEITGFTPEDDRAAQVAEALLARDLSKNCFEAVLFQFLLDIARFGLGVIKTRWSVEEQEMVETVTNPAKMMNGVPLQLASTQEVKSFGISYEGNRITNISPYRFFPDVRLPLVRYQEGEFCASAESYSHSRVKEWEAAGEVVGTEFIKPLGKDLISDKSYRWDDTIGIGPEGVLQQGAGLKSDGQVKATIFITEVQRNIIPAEYKIDDKPLGDEEYPVKYVVWLANESRVIKFERMNYAHNEFTYSLAPFVFDNNILVSDGLSDVIDPLQSVISWFLNSRITNVRKVIGDKLIVNPQFVNMSDLSERRPVIRLSAAATGEIDRHIKQLALNDVTTTHVQDVKTLHDLIKLVTGINDSLLGEVRPGRRSATENRNTTSGAAARIKTLALIIFRFSLEQAARQMVSNLRDGLDEPTYVKLLGNRAATTPEFIQVTKADLVGNYDFEIFDGTLPSEKYLVAQALEEILAVLLKTPQAAMTFNLDVKKILFEVLRLRGVKNPERFELTMDQQLQLMQNAQLAATTGQQPNAAPGGAGPASGAAGPPPGVPSSMDQSILPLPPQAVAGGGAVGY